MLWAIGAEAPSTARDGRGPFGHSAFRAGSPWRSPELGRRKLADRRSPRWLHDRCHARLRSPEGAKVAESVETPREPVRIPFALKVSRESQPSAAARDMLSDKSPAPASGADKVPPPVPTIAVAAVPDANVETSEQPSGKVNVRSCGVDPPFSFCDG